MEIALLSLLLASFEIRLFQKKITYEKKSNQPGPTYTCQDLHYWYERDGVREEGRDADPVQDEGGVDGPVHPDGSHNTEEQEESSRDGQRHLGVIRLQPQVCGVIPCREQTDSLDSHQTVFARLRYMLTLTGSISKNNVSQLHTFGVYRVGNLRFNVLT